MQKKPLPTNLPTSFQSQVHGTDIHLQDFLLFLQHSPVSLDNYTYPQTATIGAEYVYSGGDLRVPVDGSPVREFFYTTYLPLPCHTHFVERGVKEAANVSKTDRSEPLRSAYVINRDARVHSLGNLSDLSSTERITKLIRSAIQHNDKYEVSVQEPGYKEAVEEISKLLREDHFKHERQEAITLDITDNSSTNRASNAIQRKTGVDTTVIMAGLIPYSKVLKATHMEPLMEELLHRGITVVELKSFNNSITAMKKALKQLETDRVVALLPATASIEDRKKAAATATKAFRPLSTADFK
jgi:phosphotransferase system HPr-like phosphotransfer protein